MDLLPAVALGLLLLPIVVKIGLMVREYRGRVRTNRAGWAGYVVIDNRGLFHSPTLHRCARRTGVFLSRFSKTIQEEGLVTGWLYVDDEIRFKPNRGSVGDGARSFRLAADQLDAAWVDDTKLYLRIRGEPGTIDIFAGGRFRMREPQGLAEALDRLM